jgi:hypothetical protein
MMMGRSAAPGCAAIAKVRCESQMVETVPSKIALVAFIAATSPHEERRRRWRPAFSRAYLGEHDVTAVASMRLACGEIVCG